MIRVEQPAADCVATTDARVRTLESSVQLMTAEVQWLRADADSLFSKLSGVLAIINGGALVAASTADSRTLLPLTLVLSTLSIVLAGPSVYPLRAPELLDSTWAVEYGSDTRTMDYLIHAAHALGDTCRRLKRQSAAISMLLRWSVTCAFSALGSGLGLALAGSPGAVLGTALGLTTALSALTIARAVGLSSLPEGGEYAMTNESDEPQVAPRTTESAPVPPSPQPGAPMPQPVPSTSIREGGGELDSRKSR